ncbi:MAG TPA: 16S rRNA (uracil(1498)-N(3))-methyltransferase [Quisquiliibacterium sp.]|nr:16S rRNA (uracil(1498)-N(3))-methyltransferase [Quisquiliibacterium sp.]
MTPRLYLPAALSPGDEAALDRDQSHYTSRVLRLRTGDALQVFDGAGARHAASIVDADPRRCVLRIGEALQAGTESPLRVTLAQCVSASEKMDWTIEKAVELGVAEIVPLQSKRSVVRLDPDRARRRAEHWQRLIVAACMQCGRDLLPALRPVQGLSDWLTGAPQGGLRVVLAPGAHCPIGALPGNGSDLDSTVAVVLVGPESGFADDELEQAIASGFRPVSIGPRILRTETAGLAALSVLQARFGDLR